MQVDEEISGIDGLGRLPRFSSGPRSTAFCCSRTHARDGRCDRRTATPFVYADATTAAGSTLGDYKNRVSNVRLWATSPGATQATAETLTSYAYDTSGRLRTVWDPQISPALKTAYTYNADGRIETLTEPGRAPWTFVYGTTGSAATAGAGMLLTASRPALASGSASQVSGTAVTSLVYDVPLTGAKAPLPMDSASVAAWGQKEAPTDATAVFPPGSVPSSHNGATSRPTRTTLRRSRTSTPAGRTPTPPTPVTPSPPPSTTRSATPSPS